MRDGWREIAGTLTAKYELSNILTALIQSSGDIGHRHEIVRFDVEHSQAGLNVNVMDRRQQRVSKGGCRSMELAESDPIGHPERSVIAARFKQSVQDRVVIEISIDNEGELVSWQGFLYFLLRMARSSG